MDSNPIPFTHFVVLLGGNTQEARENSEQKIIFKLNRRISLDALPPKCDDGSAQAPECICICKRVKVSGFNLENRVR